MVRQQFYLEAYGYWQSTVQIHSMPTIDIIVCPQFVVLAVCTSAWGVLNQVKVASVIRSCRSSMQCYRYSQLAARADTGVDVSSRWEDASVLCSYTLFMDVQRLAATLTYLHAKKCLPVPTVPSVFANFSSAMAAGCSILQGGVPCGA